MKSSVKKLPTVYLLISRKTEAILASEFIPIINQSLNTFVPTEIRTFRSLFQYLMELASQQPFNLVIDEFQEFHNINKSVHSDMKNIWDTYRKKSKMNLIVSYSTYPLVYGIFQNDKENLLSGADSIIELSAFDSTTLKQIMDDYNPRHNNDDLLALYTFTGGVPKYVAWFCNNHSLTVDAMISFMVREDSPFIDEGKRLFVEEFRRNYATYFSILSAVSGGINTHQEIEATLGDKTINGQISKLIMDYNILVRQRPILAKGEPQPLVRYEIQDNFVRFWFNYLDRHRSLIETKNFAALRDIIKSDYPNYSVLMLERYFKQKFAESHKYDAIGSWWELKDNQNRIDIVALKLGRNNQAIVVEVRRNKINYKPSLLAKKAEHFVKKLLPGYRVEVSCLSLKDM